MRVSQEPEYVFVVGTAHFSERSADDVERVIEVCHHPIWPALHLMYLTVLQMRLGKSWLPANMQCRMRHTSANMHRKVTWIGRTDLFNPGDTGVLSAMHMTEPALSQAVRPESVVVEVCRSRAAILYDEKPQEEGSSQAPQSNSMSLTCAAFLLTQLDAVVLQGVLHRHGLNIDRLKLKCHCSPLQVCGSSVPG